MSETKKKVDSLCFCSASCYGKCAFFLLFCLYLVWSAYEISTLKSDVKNLSRVVTYLSSSRASDKAPVVSRWQSSVKFSSSQICLSVHNRTHCSKLFISVCYVWLSVFVLHLCIRSNILNFPLIYMYINGKLRILLHSPLIIFVDSCTYFLGFFKHRFISQTFRGGNKVSTEKEGRKMYVFLSLMHNKKLNKFDSCFDDLYNTE